MALSYENLSRLVTGPDLLPHLQDLKLDKGEKNVSFQWLGPHLLAFLRYATNLCLCNNYKHDRFGNLLKRLDDLASDCIFYGETEHYKKFEEVIVSFFPELREFIAIQKLQQLSDSDNPPNRNELVASFIGFLVETIGELLTCGTDSSVLMSNQVKFLLKELESLLTFLADTSTKFTEQEQENNILTEIESVVNEAGSFLSSFFFTTELVDVTNMDLTLAALVERTEIVQLKIKDHFIAVPKQLDCGIGSLQVAESQSEVSSYEKSDPVTEQIMNHLLRGANNRQIISIVGMPGLGKTTLAKKLYDNSNVRSRFDVLSWCVVSQTYSRRKLLIDILRSASHLNGDEISNMEDEELGERLHKNLSGRRYLVVMDDLWDEEAWGNIRRFFPENKNASRVLFTSRLNNVASKISHSTIEPPPLTPDESWNILELMVFKKERYPEFLQGIGMEIAANCNGLPLSVIMVAGVLSNIEEEENLWQQVADNLNYYISDKANDYFPTLSLSYMHLPNYLKPCFLYLSAFQEDEEIPIRKLFLLWIAEGFIEKKEHKTLEDVAEEYLTELINRSLLQVSKRRSDNGVKTCTLHDLVLDMCTKIAVEDEKFLFQHQFMIFKHRYRLCKDPSHHLSEALSILYNSEKIRILDSLYGGIVRLAIKVMPDLRYLEIQSLESSISKLKNLEFLRVEEGCTIPTYILNMPKLRHLRVGRLYNPASFSMKCDSSQINNLQTLSCISIYDSEDEKILRCSPNLRRLKCKSPNNFCPDLNFLSHLESLTMVYGSRFEGDNSMVQFPKNIKKLTLSKIGLPWEKMSLIETLSNLEILKLEWDAFEGKIWNTEGNEFRKLKFLQLFVLDLREWNSSDDRFPVLERLVLRSCKNLEMIPLEFGKISTLQNIEVYNCHEKIVSSVQEIRDEQRDNSNDEFEVTISSIWD